MKRIKLFTTTIMIAAFGFLLTGAADDYYLKINKAFDVFGSIFRTVSLGYVIDADPELLMRSAIDGMLTSLDPYTTYYDESETDNIDMLTQGAYSGYGFTVKTIDSMLTIVGVREGYSADRNGLRIGDRIYSVNANVVLNESTSNLRKYTKGKIGEVAILSVLRDGLQDTLSLIMTREKIQLKVVSHKEILANKIAYIKLDRFTRQSAKEVKKAIQGFRRQTELNALVLDLRGNPGGLLDAAVSITEIFLPKGSIVVSTKGKRKENIYKSRLDPIEPDIPLAILIDGSSASASEIIAGAIQDHDRGLIIGRKSFGKGLVQSVFKLPFKRNFKMTTARYYTPSGRCIQKMSFGKKYIKKDKEVADSSFRTKNERIVYESDGITPDSSIAEIIYPRYVRYLFSKHHFFNFTNLYFAKYDSIPADYRYQDTLINAFQAFLTSKNISYKAGTETNLTAIKKKIEEETNSKKLLSILSKFEQELTKHNTELFDTYRKDIAKVLEVDFKTRYLTDKQFFKFSMANDEVLHAAERLIISRKYKKMLTDYNVKPENQN